MIVIIVITLIVSIFLYIYTDEKNEWKYMYMADYTGIIKKLPELKTLLRENSPVSPAMIKHWETKDLPTAPPINTLPTSFILPSPYKDTKCQCIEDEANVAILKKARIPVNACIKYLADLSDAYIWYKTPIDDKGIISYINSLADSKVLKTVNSQGTVERVFRFHIPLVIIALRCPTKLDPDTLAWIKSYAIEHQQTLQDKQNNLKAWLVLDLAVTWLLTNDANIETSVDKGWNDALNLTTPDGSLPSEDERDGKKVEYYEFFCKAVITTGYVLNKKNDKIPKMIAKTVGLDKQNLSKMYWLYLYNRMYPEAKVEEAAVQTMLTSINSRLLGGHVLLFS